jgi:ferredoxin-NADP reductase
MLSKLNWQTPLVRARRPINALLRTRAVSAMCTPHEVDDYLGLFDAAWSVREVRARVVAVEPEAGGATSLWLAPNENWRGFRAGQYVSMSVCIDGVWYRRCFSLSSSPEDGAHLRVTIKALPDGRVGSWAAHAARRGDVVRLSQALGDFVLPRPVPARLLFVSGGSGITPIVSMIRHLLATGYDGEIACLHYARHECTLGAELTALAARHSAFRFVPVLTGRPMQGRPQLGRHFSSEHLACVAPRWTECETFVCGPASLEAAVTQLLRERDLGHRLHVERFVGAAQVPQAATALRCRLTFVRSGREVIASASASLLEQAEDAGLRPRHGCRMGICHSCKCKKVSGVVRNQLTGALSTEPDEEIQLCVSTPHSNVTLDL